MEQDPQPQSTPVAPAPAAEPPASQTRLYVSNLDPAVSNRKTEADLREIFSKFGTLLSVSVRRNEKHKKVYAFVEFAQPQEAAEAVDNLHNSYFGDERIRVEYQRGQTGERREQRRTGRDMGNVTCFRCRQPGHFARDCQQKPDNNDHHRLRREGPRRRSRSRTPERRRRQPSSSSSSSSSSSRRSRDRAGRRRERSSSSSSGSSSR